MQIPEPQTPKKNTGIPSGWMSLGKPQLSGLNYWSIESEPQHWYFYICAWILWLYGAESDSGGSKYWAVKFIPGCWPCRTCTITRLPNCYQIFTCTALIYLTHMVSWLHSLEIDLRFSRSEGIQILRKTNISRWAHNESIIWLSSLVSIRSLGVSHWPVELIGHRAVEAPFFSWILNVHLGYDGNFLS